MWCTWRHSPNTYIYIRDLLVDVEERQGKFDTAVRHGFICNARSGHTTWGYFFPRLTVINEFQIIWATRAPWNASPLDWRVCVFVWEEKLCHLPGNYCKEDLTLDVELSSLASRVRFLCLVPSKLRLCSANHRPGYWSNLTCNWPSTAWAYSEHWETENIP